MSQGLQVFDAAGRIVVDVQDRLPRVYSTHSVSVTTFGPQTGFVAVAGMARDGRWLIVAGPSNQEFSYFSAWAVSGGFNWIHQSYGASASCTFTVFKL